MKVRDIMTTAVETATPDTSLEQIATMMKNENVGAIPIVDGDELAGIITDRDIVVRCIAAGKDPSETEAEEILSEDLETIEPTDDIEEAARIMSDRQIRRLPVCERGRLVGMISLGDIAVKENETTAGDTLENISEGVKTGGKTSAPARSRKQVTQSSRGASGDRGGDAQGISNRARGGELERQQRVNPQRAAAGSSARRRRAS